MFINHGCKSLFLKGEFLMGEYLPRVCINVNGSEINTKNLMVPDKVSSDLLSICIWVELNSVRC